MKEPSLLKNRIISQHNRVLITVVALGKLYYIQNEYSNIVQRVNTQFTFTNNVPKRFMESFHQIGYLVSYESLCCDLQANAKAVMEEILEKTQTQRFYISYNNMNFYENICD